MDKNTNLRTMPLGENKKNKSKGRELLINIKRHFPLYIMLLPCIASFIVFSYLPMVGLVLAFKEYKFNMGILGSPWVGLRYFKNFFLSYDAYRLVINTVVIGTIKTIFEFPFPIILALMLNEVRNERFKKLTQTISYLPNFISWVIIVTMLQRILAPDTGLLNQFKALLGGDPGTFYMMEEKYFYPIIFLSDLWKNMGWSSIIYLAAISGIDPTLYEAAKIDGANKWREIWNVTLPGIRTTIGVLFIMGVGGIISSGYDQIYLLRTPGNMSLADTLDVYVVRVGLSGGQYGYGTAIGMIQGIVGLILVIICNKLSRKYTEVSIW
ncbi:ABC transporter permease subunit [Pseudoclostridium thermosuccinogenes]|uniref:ABC transporter permease n=1 Tax=Clostridium thermosuccinogenes TaxID=84032 RepID=UPI002FDA05EF